MHYFEWNIKRPLGNILVADWILQSWTVSTFTKFNVNFSLIDFPHLSSRIKRNVSPILPNSPVHVPKFDVSVNPLLPFVNHPIAIGSVSSTNNLCKMDQNVVSTQNYEMEECRQITKDSTPAQLGQWLAYHRLSVHNTTFAHFSGSDMLRWIFKKKII